MTVETQSQLTPEERCRAIRDAMPANGLFAGHEWRVSPEPFYLTPQQFEQLESLGAILLQFYRSANLLYRQSVRGKQPAWIQEWLDAGKPDELIAFQRDQAFKQDLPRVIRPDLLITEDGFSMTELDSVPGGIGLTAWLNQAYQNAGFDVVGGDRSMENGFRGIFDSGKPIQVLVSNEAAGYKPEMEWLAGRFEDESVRVLTEPFDGVETGASIYRFFELFDFDKIKPVRTLFETAARAQCQVTPPPKPALEEKMLFGLFWNKNLEAYWRQELGAGYFKRLKSMIPYTWILDPAPMPPQAAYPGLELTDWRQLKILSQKQRQLILKVSGFSEKAWGSRGVHLGSDLSAGDWSDAVETALRSFPTNPYILQPFQKPVKSPMQWMNFKFDSIETMHGRVRLCPYYFVHGPFEHCSVRLAGILATCCPSNKKIIHGMSEAILAPAAVKSDNGENDRPG